ncbi:chromosomal replication initiation protein DnaA [Humibacillus sp. DSM 29435]|uniref:chromosomal replication initiator protein DnaA n=1 Tax=Humibacillus sp. DSM 29435 TaxID=1869167 RepID=UPI0008732383|nr:chromosomal replication initiator protein DnaA [Humibacillus sp. DSM 29435]OFE14208.1 chromosomal replication initiation protein DnaA [Humibacillus sp. DSM 29435]
MTDRDVDYVHVWKQTLHTLDTAGVSARDLAFVRLCRLVGVLDETALVKAPNAFTKEFLETKVRDLVLDALRSELGEHVQLAVTVDEALGELSADPMTDGTAGERWAPTGQGHPFPTSARRGSPEADSPYWRGEHPSDLRRDPLRDLADSAPDLNGADLDDHYGGGESGPSRHRFEPPMTGDTRLNPKYNFDTFVIGASNRFAHAAAVAVAEAPAKAYNPLFVYGESGLGKTHLLHAIGHYARSMFPNVRVRYVNSEEFTNDFINSIRDDKASAFQARYRNVDVLLIDDIQFLQGKLQTQEEFFHTFNTLHNANKQIVITSDLPPKELSGFEDRMRTRFESGLLTDVQPPDLETRIAILRKKAIQDRMSVPDDVLEYIATNFSTNIRELEGALIRVTAFSNLNRQPIDLPLAEIVLKDVLPNETPNQVTAATIMAVTAGYYSVTMDDLCGSSRSRQLVTARQIAMYLCREMTDLSLPKIGQLFGGRDHTTVMHANKKIRELMSEKRAIYNQVTELTNRIRQQSH